MKTKSLISDAARPFPYTLLQRFSRGEVVRLRALCRRLTPTPAPRRDAFGAAWRGLLGETLVASPGTPRVTTAEAAREAWASRAWAAVFAHPTAGAVALLVDVSAALVLASRALGGDAADASTALTPAREGALVTLAARAATLAFAPEAPPIVRAVTDDLRGALDAVGDPTALVAWPWRITAGDLVGEVTAVVSQRSFLRAEERSRPDVLARLGEVPVEVAVIAGRAVWSAREAASLRPGDALVFDTVTRRGGALFGRVVIAAGARGELSVEGELVGRRAVRVAGGLRSGESHVVSTRDGDANERTVPRAESLGALTVEVSVEVARATVELAEVAAWRAGEVVTFGRALGEAVTVHVSGRPVARCELVDVDGEVGVRILELL